MIRAITREASGRWCVVFGLGPENLRRLQEGEPILANLRHLDPGGEETPLPDINIVIAFDDRALSDWLKGYRGVPHDWQGES